LLQDVRNESVVTEALESTTDEAKTHKTLNIIRFSILYSS